MITTIEELIQRAAGGKRRTLAVAAAHDSEVLQAVAGAVHQNLIAPILIGACGPIQQMLRALGETPEQYTVIDAADNQQCAQLAVQQIIDGNADFLMKGLLGTAELMRAVINKEQGLRTGSLISHVSLYEAPRYGKLLALTDGGMNPYPDLQKKAAILHNAAAMLQKLGYECATAACICGAEVVDPKIQATVDAAQLVQMEERWLPLNLNVIGPVGLDLAISRSACVHKGYHIPGGGEADILLVPTYEVGNAVGKTLTYFAGAKSAGIILGASVPIVLVSRSDDSATKLASIALGSLLTQNPQ